jgi:hypothetical protein
MPARDADQAELSRPQAKRTTPETSAAAAAAAEEDTSDSVSDTSDQELPELVVVPFIQLDMSRSYLLFARNWPEGKENACKHWIDEWGGPYKTIHQMLCDDLDIDDPCTPADADEPRDKWAEDAEEWKDPYAPGGEATLPDSRWPIKPYDLDYEIVEAPDCEAYAQASRCGHGCSDHDEITREFHAIDNEQLAAVELRAYIMRCEKVGIDWEWGCLPRIQLCYPTNADDEHDYPFISIKHDHTYMLCIEMDGVPLEEMEAIIDDKTACALAHLMMCTEIGIPSHSAPPGMSVSSIENEPRFEFVVANPAGKGIAMLHMFPTPRSDTNPAMDLAFEFLARSGKGRDNIIINPDELQDYELAASIERAKHVRIVPRPSPLFPWLA